MKYPVEVEWAYEGYRGGDKEKQEAKIYFSSSFSFNSNPIEFFSSHGQSTASKNGASRLYSETHRFTDVIGCSLKKMRHATKINFEKASFASGHFLYAYSNRYLKHGLMVT